MLFESTYCQAIVFDTSLGTIDDDPFVYELEAQAVQEERMFKLSGSGPPAM